jgi:predicted nucleic acid-binding protein
VILADTSVWVDHLRAGDHALRRALIAGEILMHPFVIGEVALGHLRRRRHILESLYELPKAGVATDTEVLYLIDQANLAGRGIGYIDAHLLAAARLSGNAALWTRDRTLRDAAEQLGVAYAEP